MGPVEVQVRDTQTGREVNLTVIGILSESAPIEMAGLMRDALFDRVQTAEPYLTDLFGVQPLQSLSPEQIVTDLVPRWGALVERDAHGITIDLNFVDTDPQEVWRTRAAIASSTGSIASHGLHHGAQKSTMTGPGTLSTSSSKLASVTSLTAAPGALRGATAAPSRSPRARSPATSSTRR